MRTIVLITITLLFLSCENENSKSTFTVEHKGALKNIMHKGDVTAKANLSDYKNIEHLYALGALENLKGEIQIFDGQPFNTYVVDSTLKFDNTFDKKASLFVYAEVESWNSINIPENVVTYDELEIFIDETAEKTGIDINEPFPFLINGIADSFDWHVINWKDGDTEHSHEKHVNSGLHGTLKNQEVELLGFYSNTHHAIFTHHTTNMHIHVKTKDGKTAGHVDGLTLGKNMVLLLPK